MRVMVGGQHENQPTVPGAVQIEVLVRQTFGTRYEQHLPLGWFTEGERHKREPHDVAIYNARGYALYERFVKAKVWVIDVASLDALFGVARICGKWGLLVRAADDDEGGLPEAIPHECES